MNNSIKYLALLPIFLLSYCSKSEDESKITLTVVDNAGLTVEGAKVEFFKSREEYIAGLVYLETTTRSDGKVSITGVPALAYYFRITKGCNNNLFGDIRFADIITPDLNNIATVKISPTGEVLLINNSSHPFQIFLNGTTTLFRMEGGTVITTRLPVGNNEIRVLQLSGYTLYPTDKTYQVLTACDNGSIVSFP